jgi:hypothetical protein
MAGAEIQHFVDIPLDQTAPQLFDELGPVKQRRDHYRRTLEELLVEFQACPVQALWHQIAVQRDGYRQLHLVYMALSSEWMRKSKDSEAVKAEKEDREGYLATYQQPILQVATLEQEREQQAVAKMSPAHNSREGRGAKSVSDLMPDMAHLKLAPIEFEDFKKAANVWYLESKFDMCANQVQSAYAAKIFESAFLDKIKAMNISLMNENPSFTDVMTTADLVYQECNSQFCKRLAFFGKRFNSSGLEELIAFGRKLHTEYELAEVGKLDRDSYIAMVMLAQMTAGVREKILLSKEGTQPSYKEIIDSLEQQITLKQMTKASQESSGLAGGPAKGGRGNHSTNNLNANSSGGVNNRGGGAGGGAGGGNNGGGNSNIRQRGLDPRKHGCFSCNGDHQKFQCTVDPQTLLCDKSKGGCGGTGHVAEVCRGRERGRATSRDDTAAPRRPSDSRSPAPNGSAAPRTAGRSTTPHPARHGGNMIRASCGAVGGQGSEDLPRIECSVWPMMRTAGWGCPIKSMLDTGCTMAVLREDKARDIGAKLVDTTVTLSTASGAPMQVSGEAEVWVQVPSCKYRRKIRSIVSRDAKEEFMLGAKELKQLNLLHKEWPAPPSGEAEESGDEDVSEHGCNVVEDSEVGEKSKGEPHEEEEPADVLGDLHLGEYTDIPGFQEFDPSIKAVIKEFSDVFSSKLSAHKKFNMDPVELKLRENYERPKLCTRARNVPAHWEKEFDKIIDNLLDESMIEEIPDGEDVEFMSPGFLVPRPNDATRPRLVIDYKGPNRAMSRVAFPQAGPEEVVARMRPGNKLHYSFDLCSGYWQIPLERKSSMRCTGFLCQRGAFYWLRCPFGLVKAGDVFNAAAARALDEVRDIIFRDVDDLLGGGVDEEDVACQLRRLFTACRTHGLTLAPKKAQIAPSVLFAGIRVTPNGVLPDPKRLECVSAFPRPQNRHELKRFLGLACTLNSWTDRLQLDSNKMKQLLRKDVAFLWDESVEMEFQQLKEHLSDPVILSSYDPDMALGISVDCNKLSGCGFAAFNFDEDNFDFEMKRGSNKGKIKLLKMGSVSCKPAWKNFSALETETLGCCHAVHKLEYLTRGNPMCHVFSDHEPLVKTYENKTLDEMTPRMCRLLLQLREFNVTFHWVTGDSSDHILVDALGRAPVSDSSEFGEDALDGVDDGWHREVASMLVASGQEIFEDDPQLAEMFAAGDSDRSYKQCIQEVRKGTKREDLKKLPEGCLARTLKEVWPEVGVKENTRGQAILTVGATKIIPPSSMRSVVIKQLLAMHQGVKKTIALGKERFYWCGFSSQLEQACSSCEGCVEGLPSLPDEEEVESEPPKEVWEKVGADMFQFDGQHFLLLVDYLSNYIVLHKFSRTPSATMTVKAMSDIFNEYGFVRTLRTDGAGCFDSAESHKFYNDNFINVQFSSGTHARSNGLSEVSVKKVKGLMHKCKKLGENFNEAFALMQDCPQMLGELSPARMLWRRQKRHPALFSLPGDDQDEGDAAQVQFERKEEDKRKRNSKMGKNRPKPVHLQVGLRVLIQSKSGRFSIPGKVVRVRSERSAHFEIDSGRVILRNRRFCRLDPAYGDHLDPQVVNMVCSVEGNVGSVAQSAFKREKGPRKSVRLLVCQCRHQKEVLERACGGVVVSPGQEEVCCCADYQHTVMC